MKRIIFILLALLMGIFFTCNKEEETPKATCTDGIQNGNETGIDCGGDCRPCFDCMSNYCALLTGATSDQSRNNVKWISVQAQGSPDDGSWKFTFYNTGSVYETFGSESGSGDWEFDDPDSPTEIVIYYDDPPTGWSNPISLPLLRLDEDTLGLHSGTWEYYFVKE